MARHIFAFTAFVIFSSTSLTLHAQQYLAGPSPTIGDIIHTADSSSGLDPNRLKLGMTEALNCSVDPGTWEDIDYEQSASTLSNTPRYDSMGDVTWSVNGSAVAFPSMGLSTVVTTIATDADYTFTVEADIEDAGLFKKDKDPAGGDGPALKKEKAANAVAPNDIELDYADDKPSKYPADDPNAPDKTCAGAYTTFYLHCLPDDVKYPNMKFSELLPAGSNDPFPNGTSAKNTDRDGNEIPAGGTRKSVALADTTTPQPDNTTHRNGYTDTLAYIVSIGVFFDGNNFKDWTSTMTIPLFYQDANQNWIKIKDNDHVKEYKYMRGALRHQGRVKLKIGAQGIGGQWQGPFGTPPAAP